MHPHRHESNERAYRAPAAERALVACSLWLYVGFIGAAAFGAGLILHFGADAGGAATLAVAIGGGVLALGSWARARAVLEQATPESDGPPARFLRNPGGAPKDRFQPRAYANGPMRPGVRTPLQLR